LEQKERYSLGKTERLKSRKTIEQLFREGRSFSTFPFRVLWMYIPSQPAVLQAGFAVSSKHFKNAVDRNRVKRLMRETYRLQKNALAASLEQQQKPMAVFFIYLGNELPEYQSLFDRTGAVLKRLIKITNENSPADT
jgi:ribonuclease P protein component